MMRENHVLPVPWSKQQLLGQLAGGSKSRGQKICGQVTSVMYAARRTCSSEGVSMSKVPRIGWLLLHKTKSRQGLISVVSVE